MCRINTFFFSFTSINILRAIILIEQMLKDSFWRFGTLQNIEIKNQENV